MRSRGRIPNGVSCCRISAMSPSSPASASSKRGDGNDERAVPRSTISTTTTISSKAKGRNVVYVYSGKGAGARSALSAARALERSLPLASVRTLSTRALLEGSWARVTGAEGSTAAALVMPGGADLPYVADLAGEGNAVVREFVRDAGGTYLGLCAGAYYGCSRVEFEPLSETLRVVGERELSFFPGVALGAVVPGFEYETETGAAATTLRWRRAKGTRRERSEGGEGEQDDGDVDGGEWRRCRDYCNGGPVFVLPGGEEGAGKRPSSTCRVPDECELDGVGVEVLARYDGAPSSSASNSPAVAAAAEGGAAAVRCSVGNGIAVLCGTHPELSPAGEWLLPPSASSSPSDVVRIRSATAVATPTTDAKVSELVSSLDSPEAAKERRAYWESLLDAAGLGGLRG